MGLDWMVGRREDGTEPMETAGALRVDKENPLAVAALRELYEIQHQYTKDGYSQSKLWSQDFDAVLMSAQFDGMFLANTIPDDCPGLAAVSGMLASRLDFRGKCISYMRGLPDTLGDAAYADMSPDDAVEYADALEQQVEQVPGEERPTLESAISWLRYWGGHGHPIYAWY